MEKKREFLSPLEQGSIRCDEQQGRKARGHALQPAHVCGQPPCEGDASLGQGQQQRRGCQVVRNLGGRRGRVMQLREGMGERGRGIKDEKKRGVHNLWL